MGCTTNLGSRGRRSDRRTVAILMLTAGLPVLGGTTLVVVLPAVAESLHTSAAAVVSIVTVYFAVQLAAQPFAGALATRIGAQRAVTWGLAILGLGSLAAALSPAVPMLLVARGLQAVGATFVLPGVHAQLAADPDRDGSRFGWLTSISNMAAAAGPLLGALLLASVGWRGVFVITLVLAGAAGLALTGQRADVQHAAARPAPVPIRAVVADRRSAAGAGINALDNAVVQAILISVPFALVASGALTAATALATVTIASTVAAPLGGRLAGRAGHGFTARTGFVFAAAGLLMLHQTGVSPVTPASLVALAVVGVGLGLEFPSIQAAPLARVAAGGRATAAGVMATARQLGSLGGALLASAVVVTNPRDVCVIAAAAAMLAAVLTTVLDAPANRRPEAEWSPAAAG
jgi:MFS family permease